MPMTKTRGRTKLRELAKERTQQTIADVVGVSQPTICDWCAGRTRPTPVYRTVIERKLNIPADDWLTAKEHSILRASA